MLFTELVFPEEAQDTPHPGTADPELDGFLPVADPSILQSVTLLDNAENFFEGEEIADKPPTGLTKRKRVVINPVKWTSQEEVVLNTKFRKYIERETDLRQGKYENWFHLPCQTDLSVLSRTKFTGW